ncbi:MAG: hypothetical protein KGZ82_05580 [Bacteroidales bacterium]|nr:hypothetical protein [Bacteroidales bacterium]
MKLVLAFGSINSEPHATFASTTFLFDRGYTGHEHLYGMQLLNPDTLHCISLSGSAIAMLALRCDSANQASADMNGRVYDPFVARFLSPDPFIPNATATQSYNRYSYCINNPLKYTDPSGYTQKPDDYEFKHGEGSSNMFNAPFFGAGYNGGFNSGGLRPVSGGLGNYSGISDDNNNHYLQHWSVQYRDPKFNEMLLSSFAYRMLYNNKNGFWIPGIDKINYNYSLPSEFENGAINLPEIEKTYIFVWSSFNPFGKKLPGQNGGGELANNQISGSEKAALGLAAISGSVNLTTGLIDKLSGTVKNADIVNFGKSVTKKFGLVGVGLTTYNSYSDGIYTVGDGARILMSGLTFIPYAGWIYGAFDMGVLITTGTSATDRIGDYVDLHWGPGPTRP